MVAGLKVALSLLTTGIVGVASGSEILTPVEIQGSIKTPRLEFGSPDFTGTVTLQKFDITWCKHCAGPPADFTVNPNTGIFLDDYYEECFACGYAEQARWVKDVGATAYFIYSFEEAGHEYQVIHDFGDWENQRGFPVYEIGQTESDKINSTLNDGQVVTIDVSDVENPWEEWHNGGFIGIQAFIAAITFPVMLLGMYRLAVFVKLYQKTGNYKTAVFVLFIESLCSLIRLLYISVDPMWSKGIINYGIGRVFLTITVPLELVGSVALLLAWDDMLSMNRKIGSFLSAKHRIALALITLTFCGFDIVMSCLAAFKGLVLLSFASAALLAVFTLFTAIGVLYSGFKLIKQLKLFSSIGDSGSASMGGNSSNAFDSVQSSSDVGDTAMSSFVVPPTSEGTSEAVSGKVGTLKTFTSKKSFKKAPKKKMPTKKSLQSLNSQVMTLAVILVFQTLLLPLAGLNPLFFRIVSRNFLIMSIFFLLTWQAYVKIMFFKTPRN